MDPVRLTGYVYPVKKNGVPVRGRFQLWVNLCPWRASGLVIASHMEGGRHPHA